MKVRINQSLATLLAIAFTLLVAPAAAPLSAEELNHNEARVKVWIPDGWTQEADEQSLIINDPAEEVMVVFLVVEGSKIETALDAMEQELASIVENVTSEGEPQEVELNGMPAIVLDGKGTVEGEAVDLGIAVLRTPADKALLVFAIAKSSAVAKHEKTIEKILSGIKPLN